MNNKPDKIINLTNKTMIPISFLIIVWFIINWALELKNKTEINAMSIAEGKYKQDQIVTKLDRNNERLAKIEEALEFLKEIMKNKK